MGDSDAIVACACIVLALIGLVLVYVSDTTISVKTLSHDLLGKKVVLSGHVDSKRMAKGHVFLDVNGQKVVVFESEARQSGAYFLGVNDSVNVLGRVQEYKGELELVASEVWV